MPAVYEFPRDWYLFVTAKFYLQARSQMATRPWIGGRSVYGPHAQLWTAGLTMGPQQDPVRRDIAAFFSRLDGQVGLMRIGDPSRKLTWHDKTVVISQQNFDDNTGFTDGTGWESGTLPSTVYVYSSAMRGSSNLVLSGFPVSTAAVLRRGDLIEILPGGVQVSYPMLYEVQYTSGSDSTGKCGIEIRPRLRVNVAVNDAVALRNTTSVFRLIDDDQGAQEITAGAGVSIGNLGFSLIEAIDRVPV